MLATRDTGCHPMPSEARRRDNGQSDHEQAVARILPLATASSLTVALGLAGCNATPSPQTGPPAPAVTVTASRKMTLPIVVNPIATTRALEDVTIRARVKGFLEEKHFSEGENVSKGQLLLVIEEKPYQLQLEQAQAQLAAAAAALDRAEASRAREVAKAQLELDQAQLLLDQVEERRSRILLARKAASQEDYDKADAQLKKSAAQVDADRAKREQAEADYKIQIESTKAEVARAKAAVDDALNNLQYCRMSAPINGRIGELKVKVGNLVGDNGATELVSIQQLDPMGLDFRPAARYLPVATALLANGLEVRLTVEGERMHPYAGKAIFIDNVVDQTTATFLMRAVVPNPDGSLLPGEYIRAGMIVGEYADAVVVPEQSVVAGQEGARVFVIGADNKVQVTKVDPVDSYQGLRVLESGLEAGQKVIVEGIQLVRQGQVVKAEEVPLDRFIRQTVTMTSADERFRSRVSRIPGMDTTGSDALSQPTNNKVVPDSQSRPGDQSSPTPARKEPRTEREPRTATSKKVK
jgi:membrane fusion protein (multidrug efflux system)